MRFAPDDLHLRCDDLVSGDDASRAEARRELAARALELVHRHGFVVFRIGALRLGLDASREVAGQLMAELREAMVRAGAPRETRLEQDRVQETHVPSGYGTRTLLPHHDGQHCSYLTPSRLDDDGWLPQWREFGASGYTTTPAHKMYQGVFIVDPGNGLSVTTYYDWIDMLGTIYAERNGTDPTVVEPAAVARWLGANLRAALDDQPKHGCPYPSLGGMLGVSEPMWHGLSFHHGEAPLSPADRSRYPLAGPLTAACPCGDCVGDTARLFCHMMLTATGRTWRQCRERWEVAAPSERYDLLLGHNLSTVHGGLAGGAGRLLEPFCLVVDEPAGEEYERWLAASWRRRLPAADR